ncbi:hypothetical protein [Alienimonas chondri]|uniref:Uncharacterized protein n=1 Tax=Alienimonas chondri TaxID=2681879 RepID=A0ABX1VHU6_9PLAN|nr:hypothetical protein [Alienimonas chondri]NNJ27687.1 hypothetical protein [Alienimonas chondri]
MDVWVATSLENAARVVAALKDFGFWSEDVSEELFLDPKKIVHIGRRPVLIDILNDAAGLDFSECYARAERVTLEGVEMPVLALKDLRTNKMASGRPQDFGDLDNLPLPSEDGADGGEPDGSAETP